MNWDAIGSVGEVIGAAAVLITLIYLAMQTNRARIATEAGNTLATVTLHSRWRNALLQNSDLATVAAKANRGEELSEEERIQFHVLCDELFIAASVTYANGVQSGSLHEISADAQYLIDLLEKIPGAVSEWDRARTVITAVSPEFVEMINARLKQTGLGAPPTIHNRGAM